ncbi:hypothetical protein E2562_000315 [Oryza meyeriana var. granulata]|uniref:Uncharacterized protein n=1 Tax=Oryza meyeriana var. granulata TaxID=110450 RepID=A0A6G1CNP9_9ORYZ|nr:hypothetical protein E2562_000315 [Oryza meyeriana var. granulata]
MKQVHVLLKLLANLKEGLIGDRVHPSYEYRWKEDPTRESAEIHHVENAKQSLVDATKAVFKVIKPDEAVPSSVAAVDILPRLLVAPENPHIT